MDKAAAILPPDIEMKSRPKLRLKRKVAFQEDPKPAEAAPEQPKKDPRFVNSEIVPKSGRILTRIQRRQLKKDKKTHIMSQEERDAMKQRYREIKKQRKEIYRGHGKRKRERRIEGEAKRKAEEALGGTVEAAIDNNEPAKKKRRIG